MDLVDLGSMDLVDLDSMDLVDLGSMDLVDLGSMDMVDLGSNQYSNNVFVKKCASSSSRLASRSYTWRLS